MDKVYPTRRAALDGLLFDGMLIAAAASACAASPSSYRRHPRGRHPDLTVASNNAGVDDFGLGVLLATRQVKKMMSSYVGENAEFMRQYSRASSSSSSTRKGRSRADARGRRRHPGLLHQDRRGHRVAEGKEHKDFGGQTYSPRAGHRRRPVHREGLAGRPTGNLVFRKTARNFNVPAATCGRVCVAEVEEIVPAGSLDPDGIHLPGIYVHRLIQGTHEKRIEQRTVRKREAAPVAGTGSEV
jgi:3-oxoacid CoA-transferase subunit A